MKDNELSIVKLPTLNSQEAWIDQYDEAEEISAEVKQLIHLPTLAYKTAIYAHENNFSEHQKEQLLLLFQAEVYKAYGLIQTQVQLSVGNSPSDRIGHMKEFESWADRLLNLLEKELKRFTKEKWTKGLEFLTPDKEPLFYSNRAEWEKKFRQHLMKLPEIFDQLKAFKAFSKYTREVLILIRRGSAMMEITQERPEWIIQAAKNVGLQFPPISKRNSDCFLTVSQAALLIGVHEGTISRWVSSGVIACNGERGTKRRLSAKNVCEFMLKRQEQQLGKDAKDLNRASLKIPKRH